MARTLSLLVSTFGRDLGKLIGKHFGCQANNPVTAAKLGVFELCNPAIVSLTMLRTACKRNYVDMAQAVFSAIPDSSFARNHLHIAERYGHADIIRLFIYVINLNMRSCWRAHKFEHEMAYLQ